MEWAGLVGWVELVKWAGLVAWVRLCTDGVSLP